MSFYPIVSNNQENFLYILELSNVKILFLGGISFQSLLYYLPSSKLFQNSPNDDLNFKHKFEQKPENNIKFPYSKKIHDEYYIKGPMKFDLEFLIYLDFTSIDYILVSSMDELFLIPFILCNKKFKGQIFTTLPIKQAGFSLLKEFYNLINIRNKQILFEDLDSEQNFFAESEFFDLFSEKYGVEINEWFPLFDCMQLDQAFQNIHTLNYKEEKLILNDIVISPESSGYNLGSCYWILKKNGLVFAFITNGCFHNYRHSSLFDIENISNSKCDLLIMANCINEKNLDGLEMSYGQNAPFNAEILEKKLFDTLSTLLNDREMNVMMPVRNMVFILDILDILLNRFKEKNVTFFIISESLEPLINYGNANVEYLNPILQKKIYEPTPETPFSSYEKLKNFGKIVFYNSIYEFQEKNNNSSLESLIRKNTPSVYVFLDSTMRFGLSLKFLETFEEIGFKNTIILTDPFLQCKEVFMPFKDKCKSKIVYCPLDHRFTVSEVKSELLKKILPKRILIPKKLFQQLKFPGNEENFILYEEEKEIFLDEFKLCLEENRVVNLFSAVDFGQIPFRNFELEKNLSFVKVEMTVDKNIVKKICGVGAKKLKIVSVNLKKNEEFMMKMISLVKGKVAFEGSYNFKKYHQKRNMDNEIVGFVLVFEKKINGNMVYLVKENQQTKVFGSDFKETEAFVEMISEEFCC